MFPSPPSTCRNVPAQPCLVSTYTSLQFASTSCVYCVCRNYKLSAKIDALRCSEGSIELQGLAFQAQSQIAWH